MMADGNMDLHKGVKSPGNGHYTGKVYKFFLFTYISINDNLLSKNR